MVKKTAGTKKETGDRDIQSVKRALDILENVAVGGELGVTEIAQALGLHIATVHNLLRTLSKYRYLENRGGRYRIGAAAAMLAGQGDSMAGLSDFLQPWMERISRETGEAASSSVLNSGILRIVAFQPGTQQVTIHFPQWVWPQPLCIATGRLLVAELPEEQWASFISDGAQAVPDWSENDWTRNLLEIREAGYCILTHADQGGQTAMAFPVRSRLGYLLVAVGASAPTFRITPELCTQMFMSVREAAVELSRQFGCPATRLKEIEEAAMPDWKLRLP